MEAWLRSAPGKNRQFAETARDLVAKDAEARRELIEANAAAQQELAAAHRTLADAEAESRREMAEAHTALEHASRDADSRFDRQREQLQQERRVASRRLLWPPGAACILAPAGCALLAGHAASESADHSPARREGLREVEAAIGAITPTGFRERQLRTSTSNGTETLDLAGRQRADSEQRAAGWPT